MASVLVMRIDKAMVTSRLTLRESRHQIRQIGEVKAGRQRYRLARETLTSATLHSHSPPPKFAVMSDVSFELESIQDGLPKFSPRCQAPQLGCRPVI
jgi:hypothetical protein